MIYCFDSLRILDGACILKGLSATKPIATVGWHQLGYNVFYKDHQKKALTCF